MTRPPEQRFSDDSAPGYRSLRELAAESGLAGEKQRSPASRPNRPTTSPPEEPPTNGRPPGTPPPAGPPAGDARPAGRSRRRTTILIMVLVLAVLVGTGGYLGYRALAPYFGGGYRTGGSTTVDDVKLTVTGARCGLSSAPDSPVKPVGQFCTVEVGATNNSDDGAFIDFHDWSVDLDVGIRDVGPSVNAMQLPVAVVLKGRSQTLDLVFDVPTGARLSALNTTIGIRTGHIRMSVA